jgi:hypothetical protein
MDGFARLAVLLIGSTAATEDGLAHRRERLRIVRSEKIALAVARQFHAALDYTLVETFLVMRKSWDFHPIESMPTEVPGMAAGF